MIMIILSRGSSVSYWVNHLLYDIEPKGLRLSGVGLAHALNHC